jgi:hypothetical protein
MKHTHNSCTVVSQLSRGRIASIAVLLLTSTTLAYAANPTGSAATTGANIRVESATREADYTLGSIATQHLKLHVPPGFVLDPASLPAPAQNEAIELRDAHWQHDDLANERVIDLQIDWQIFVAGDTVKILPLKKLHLEFTCEQSSCGQQRLTVDVPPDKVIVSSLLPARIDAEHVKLYPDAPFPEWPLAPQLWSLAGWASVLGLALLYLAWVAGWISLPQEKHMPFRQAWRQIRKLEGETATDNLQAMRLLVRAMDQFAGHAVTAENLPQLMQRHPRLQAYAPDLQTFYAEVQQAFFAGRPVAYSQRLLTQLAKDLSQLEVA